MLSLLPKLVFVAAISMVVSTAGVASTNQVASKASIVLPFSERFVGSELGQQWTRHLDGKNAVEAGNGVLKFTAVENTHSHVELGFGLDAVRVSCKLKADAQDAPVTLGLSWDESNFVQIGLNTPAKGVLNVREVLGSYPYDYQVASASNGAWKYVAIELANDCLRFYASDDGVKFQCVHLSPRPERLAGAPKLLVLGGEVDGKIFARPNPWISAPSKEKVGITSVAELKVVELAGAQSHASADELALLAKQELDLDGQKELASGRDPSFGSVSKYHPAMKWSREVVGVKDHPYDIGVAEDGSLQFSENIANYTNPVSFFKINGYRFGSNPKTFSKNLLHGWMPMVVAHDDYDGLDLQQTVFGWTTNFSADNALFGFVRISLTNRSDVARTVDVSLNFRAATNVPAPVKWSVRLPSHNGQSIQLRVPYKIQEEAASVATAFDFESKLAETTNYWSKLIATGSRFEIPEQRVQDAYRAWIAYNFLNVAKRKGVYEVCDGSGFYSQVYGYSAALYCNALDLIGYPANAEVYCDSLLSFVHTNGLLAVNFGDTDTGTALWMMAEHYHLTGDADWLKAHVPKIRLMCKWIIEQRHSVLANSDKEPVVTKGLIRYRPYADLLHPAADYFSNSYLWKGLDSTARVFAEIGLVDDAAEFKREADAYLKDLETSMNASVFVDHGMKILPLIPDSHELWKESNGSANGYYGLIAPCLLDTGVPAWNDPKAGYIIDALEKRGALTSGIIQFHDMADHAYTYGYWMNCLQRDEVERVILGFYGSMAFGMSRDTYSAVECTCIRTGENYWMLPHTYSDTQQLRLLRNMLVREDGDTLRLGQAIPRDWLTSGKRVAVTDAPTTFGPVSYEIVANSANTMRVKLTPPTRKPAGEISISLRDPAKRKIASVRTGTRAKFEFKDEAIQLGKLDGSVTLDVLFR